MIELKKEYTILLCHVLTPIILEGLQSIYDTSKNNSQKNNVLKTFQLCLKAIPSWEIKTINTEVERIMSKTKEQPWLINLIQTIFRLTILINKLEPSEMLKENLDMGHFIHSVYIECARQFWMDPFLFYHECSSLEQKKNYNEILKIIGTCIENAIRRALPLSAIFEKLLGQDANLNLKSLNLSEMYNVKLILENTPLKGGADKPIEEEKINMLGGSNEDMKNEVNMIPNMPGMQMPGMQMQGMQMQGMQMPAIQAMPMPAIQAMPMPAIQAMPMPAIQAMPTMIGGNETNNNNINDKILNIINKNNILSDSNEDNNNNFTIHNHSANNFANNGPQMMQPIMQPVMIPQMMGGNMINNQIPQNKHHSDNKSSSTLKRIINESIRNSHHSATKSNGSNNSELKNKILKDLDSETVNYNPEDNANNYQDIFSNSDVKHTVNTHDKVEKKSREKFFNNYLNI